MSEQSARLGTIIQLIATNPGITLSGLCSALDGRGIHVSERTVAKDILALKHEYRLLPDKERLRGGYVLSDVATLSERELHLVLDLLNAFGARFGDLEATSVMNRLLPSAADSRSPARTIRQQDIYTKPPGAERTQAMLFDAMRLRQAVDLTYATPRIGKPVRLRGYPILIAFHERGWYCIVKDAKSNKFQPRRLDRIRACAPAKGLPANSSHADDVIQAEFLMSCGWGMSFPASMLELKQSETEPPIVVRFDRTVAPYILESYRRHPRGTVTPARDGTGDALFKIHLADPQEFLYWVRSFGSRAWVVSPQSVVERERAEIRRMQERYNSSAR